MTRKWNYVVSATKPTTVTHACVGYFTGAQDCNLIIGKCTRMEIHLVTPQGLEPMFDVPIYGRISVLHLFRPHGETQDLLFITTERYKFCVLEWDAASSGVITRVTGDISDQECPIFNRQIGIIDPDYRLIGLHLYDGLFKVILFDNNGQLQEPFNISLPIFEVMDVKFLYGCPEPTIAVLYQYKGTHVETYKISLDDKAFTKGPWARYKLDNEAFSLIPVPPPLCGVLIVGEETIAYCSALAFQGASITNSIKRAYCWVDADKCLLGDLHGLLHRLVITHENEEFNGLVIELLANTSIASTISYLDNGMIYIGSSYGDSQLVRLNLLPNAEGPISIPFVEVIEIDVNLGPIVDFCVVDLEKQGQSQIVTCSGLYNDSLLRMVQNGLGIYEQASVELRGIKGMWSLRSASDDPYDTFLVVSFISETRIFVIFEQKLTEAKIKGFNCQVQTLFCHDAAYNQLVQVTSKYVRSVCSTSGDLKGEWLAPDGSSVNVATANDSQVLLCTGGSNLVYLEIGDGVLKEIKSVKLDYEISCLDINPIGDNPNYSDIAAIGMRTDVSVGVYSLPELNLIAKEPLGGDMIPCSALMCSFEGISYLLCALEDGHLLNFVLSMTTGELTDRKKVSLGIQPVTLRTFKSKDAATRVFAVSDWPTVIYSGNKTLLYSNVNLKEVGHMCPFNVAAFPASLAFAKEGKLTIGTIDDYQKLHIRSIPIQEHVRRISHQKRTRTFAICSARYAQPNGNDPDMEFVHLLDDQTFMFISSYSLRQFEHGCCILSCSFSDDSNVYYCVGTIELMPELMPEEDWCTKGRILVFIVEDGKLLLIAKKETNGAVFSLRAFNGNLLAAVNQKIKLYKWVPREDGGYLELLTEYGHRDLTLTCFVQTRGDFIVVGDVMKSISLLVFEHEEGAIEERARDYDVKCMAAVEILDDDVYLGAEDSFNLFTVWKNDEAATYEERSSLEVVGRYHLGDFVNIFRHGSLVMQLQDPDMSQIPTTIFGTMNGVIGVRASLPEEQYLYLEKLQTALRKVIKGVGGFSHEQWRSFYNGSITVDAKNFLDGDLIESFLGLSRNQMEEISKAMAVPVEELMKRVEELTRLH